MHEREYPDRLVIVDDDLHVLKALRFSFEIEGYDVQTYSSGEEILDARPLQAASIIIDENLPGVSGVQAASLLRTRGVEIPIILITTCPPRALCVRAERARVDIVEKLLTDALARRVKQAMRRPITAGA